MYGLNDEQYAAVTDKAPVIFLNASAGAGKTRCLVAKIQSLMDAGILPENICAVTFTNKAANEMKKRLKSRGNINRMQISTIHSMCVQVIRFGIKQTYLKLPFSIYDNSDQLSIIKTLVKARDLPDDPYEYVNEINRLKISEEISNDSVINDVLGQYQKILKENNACDFNDLLILAKKCLQYEPVRNHFTDRWKHILVDEVQDTSEIQYKIITLLYNQNKTRTLFLVGDVSQSIYGWNGARPQNVSDFIRDYKAKVMYLTYNYRSCPEVIDHANHYQQTGKPMVAKSHSSGKISLTEFDTQEIEAEKISQALLRMENYENTAIIYRVNTRSLLFEQAFTKYRIPYKVVNDTAFYQRRVCKDLLAALKAANNPQDIESLSRIINTPKRGFGEAKKEQLLLHGRIYAENLNMPAITSFLQLLNSIRGMSPYQALNKYLHDSGYRDTLTKDSDIFMVSALLDLVVKFETVEELILASTFLERDSGRGVSLLTAHASKGLEFDRVFVVGLEQDLWPHKNSVDVEEEYRLYYVACTRARKFLNISYSRSRLFRGRPIELSPSSLFKDSFNLIYGS